MKSRFKNYFYFLYLFLAALLFFSTSVYAQTPSIQMQLNKSEINMDEALELSIRVQGGSRFTTPELPTLSNFDVIGHQERMATLDINGKMTTEYVHIYRLRPLRPGSYVIPPAKVFIDGKAFSTPSAQVKVLDKTNNYQANPNFNFGISPQQNFQQNPNAQSNPQDPSALVQNQEEVYLQAEVDKKSAYVGEQLIYTFRLFQRVSLKPLSIDFPEPKSIIREELGEPREYRQVIGSYQYLITEWKVALFPTESGRLTLEPAKMESIIVAGLGVLRNRQQIFRSNPVELNIKALPAAPKDFTGLVGNFSLRSKLDPQEIKIGETSNLDITIQGRGNIAAGKLPGIEESDYFKVYPSKPELKISKSQAGISGTKEFNFALVAKQGGKVNLNGWQFSYFNPQSGKYERLQIPPTVMTIKGSESDEKLVTAGLKQQESLFSAEGKNRSLRIIKPVSTLLSDQRLPVWKEIFYLTLLFVLPIFYFLLKFIVRYRRRLAEQTYERQRSHAFKEAKQACSQIAFENFSKKESDQLLHVLKEYLGKRFGVHGVALTTPEIKELLMKCNIEEGVHRRMMQLLESLEGMQYGGWSLNLPSEISLKQETLDLLNQVEKAS